MSKKLGERRLGEMVCSSPTQMSLQKDAEVGIKDQTISLMQLQHQRKYFQASSAEYQE